MWQIIKKVIYRLNFYCFTHAIGNEIVFVFLPELSYGQITRAMARGNLLNTQSFKFLNFSSAITQVEAA